MEIERPDPGPLIVSAFKTPTGVDFLPGAEIVVNFDVDLFADVGGADAEAIVGAFERLEPSRSACIQAVANVAVVDRRHDAEQFGDVSRRVQLVAIGVPRRSRDDSVGAVRFCRSVLKTTEHAHITKNAIVRRTVGIGGEE